MSLSFPKLLGLDSWWAATVITYLMRCFGWESSRAVAKIHFVFETLESLALALAIVLELTNRRAVSNFFWALLVVADIGRWVYGWREKNLTELEIDELKHKFTGRSISAEQASRIVPKLLPYSGIRVVAVLNPVDKEASGFAKQLFEVLRQAGWIVSIGGKGSSILGIFVDLRGGFSSLETAALFTLSATLNAEGLHTENPEGVSPPYGGLEGKGGYMLLTIGRNVI